MQTLGHAIRARRTQLGLTLDALALRIGCAKGYLSQIENGRRHHPPSEHLIRRLASTLSLDAEALAALTRWDRVPAEYRAVLHALTQSRDQLRTLLGLVEKRGLADAFHSGELAAAMEALFAAERAISRDTPTIPPHTPARIPIRNRGGEFITLPDISDPHAFAIRIAGDSMAPAYRAGDLVIFAPAPDIPSGSDCFLAFTDHHPPAVARVFFTRDALDDPCVRVQPVNLAHPPRTLRRDQIIEMHPAVCVVRAVHTPSRGRRRNTG